MSNNKSDLEEVVIPGLVAHNAPGTYWTTTGELQRRKKPDQSYFPSEEENNPGSEINYDLPPKLKDYNSF